MLGKRLTKVCSKTFKNKCLYFEKIEIMVNFVGFGSNVKRMHGGRRYCM
jgi:hypothetical protein